MGSIFSLSRDCFESEKAKGTLGFIQSIETNVGTSKNTLSSFSESPRNINILLACISGDLKSVSTSKKEALICGSGNGRFSVSVFRTKNGCEKSSQPFIFHLMENSSIYKLKRHV